jgi:hypothetical protein
MKTQSKAQDLCQEQRYCVVLLLFSVRHYSPISIRSESEQEYGQDYGHEYDFDDLTYREKPRRRILTTMHQLQSIRY